MAPQGAGPREFRLPEEGPSRAPSAGPFPRMSWPPGSPPLPHEVRLQAIGPSGPSLAALDSAASPVQGQPPPCEMSQGEQASGLGACGQLTRVHPPGGCS